jgi:hypothetical protein
MQKRKEKTTMADFKMYCEWVPWLRMAALARLHKDEVSFLYKIALRERDIVITDVKMLDQTGSSASTHIPIDAVNDFIVADVAETKAQTWWQGWGHSHPGTGKPQYSSTDHNTLADLADCAASGDRPFFTGLVFSSDGKEVTAYIALRHMVNLELKGDLVVLPAPAHTEAADWAQAELVRCILDEYHTPPTEREVEHGKFLGGKWHKWNKRWKKWVPDKNRKSYSQSTTRTPYGRTVQDTHDAKRSTGTPVKTTRLVRASARPGSGVFSDYMLVTRSSLIPGGVHPKLSRIEKLCRRRLSEVAEPGEEFRATKSAVSNCNRCRTVGMEVGDIVVCLGCERDETQCSCEEVDVTNNDTTAADAVRSAQQMMLAGGAEGLHGYED